MSLLILSFHVILPTVFAIAFADKVRTFNFSPSVSLCSYDICNLFINVPLTETIEICTDALYNGELTPSPFPCAVFMAKFCAIPLLQNH